jgi:hypothetical protein
MGWVRAGACSWPNSEGGRKIDATAVLFADSGEPPEAEKAEILRALGLESGAK